MYTVRPISKIAKTWVSILLLFLSFPVAAQYRMAYHIEVFTVLEEHILPRLIDMLPTDERSAVAHIDMQLIEDPTVVTVVYTDNATDTIYLFLGFMDGLFNYIDCVVAHWYDPNREPCDVYFDYYFGHIVERIPRPPETYAERVIPQEDQLNMWYSHRRLNDLRETMYVSALIHITMHELGHHVVGFAHPWMTINEHRELEERVDRWATDRLAQMGEPPMLGATIALGYVSQMTRFARAKGAADLATHPMPRERAEYAYSHGCVEVADPLVEAACRMLKDVIDTFE